MDNLVSESERKYYQTTDDVSELEDIFTNISQDIQHPSTEVTLDANAVMKDIMGTGFVIPSGYDVSKNVSIQTVNALSQSQQLFLGAIQQRLRTESTQV